MYFIAKCKKSILSNMPNEYFTVIEGCEYPVFKIKIENDIYIVECESNKKVLSASYSINKDEFFTYFSFIIKEVNENEFRKEVLKTRSIYKYE